MQLTRPFLQVELNEVNFDFVRAYGRRGLLPVLNDLIERHGITETTSESQYDLLEPWIQWVSAHTGKNFSEHGILRLGDINEHRQLAQIWESLEVRGITVGAVSPINAANRCADPCFFIPDPWTRSSIVAPRLGRRLHAAIAKAVNENAQDGGPGFEDAAILLAAIAKYALPEHYWAYAGLLAGSMRQKWTRALLLDLLLSNLFSRLVTSTRPDYATLFLNAGAHIQHHYMFDAAAYQGELHNPPWYSQRSADPVYQVYNLYDRIVASIAQRFANHRVVIATGLHQDAYSHELYYWRLIDHAAFLANLGIPFERIEPRMSRDAVLYSRDEKQAALAQRLLEQAKASDGRKLFTVDNRGDSLFLEFVYPYDIAPDLGYGFDREMRTGLRERVALVAIKNGEHNEIGYLVDTDTVRGSHPSRMPITGLFDLTVEHFSRTAPERLVA